MLDYRSVNSTPKFPMSEALLLTDKQQKRWSFVEAFSLAKGSEAKRLGPFFFFAPNTALVFKCCRSNSSPRSGRVALGGLEWLILLPSPCFLRWQTGGGNALAPRKVAYSWHFMFDMSNKKKVAGEVVKIQFFMHQSYVVCWSWDATTPEDI